MKGPLRQFLSFSVCHLFKKCKQLIEKSTQILFKNFQCDESCILRTDVQGLEKNGFLLIMNDGMPEVMRNLPILVYAMMGLANRS